MTESGGDLVLASFIMGGDSVYTLDVSQTKLTLHPGEQTTCTVNVLATVTGHAQVDASGGSSVQVEGGAVVSGSAGAN